MHVLSESRLEWYSGISLVDAEEERPPNSNSHSCVVHALSVMLLTVAVVLPTPHDYSGTFQGRCSARHTAPKRVLQRANKQGTRRVLYTLKAV